MATQTYVSDLQAMNPSNIQIQQTNKIATTQVQQPQSQHNSNHVQQKAQVSQSATTIIQPAQAHSGQQFIVTTSVPESGGDQGQEALTLHGGQAVYPAHVQYVDGNDPTIYASANGQMQNYQEYGQTTMYTPVSGGSYYQTTTGSQVATGITHVSTIQGQMITNQGGTYLIQGAIDGDGTPLSQTRVSPATVHQVQDVYHVTDSPSQAKEVQWLIDNYETAEGVSLPRSTLYNHYLRHCQEQNLDPMNPASFGKLIRSVFLGLRTRRLGTRGNSKYHYYGIRIKATSPLNQYTDDQTMALRQQPMYQGKKFRPANAKLDGSEASESSHSSVAAAPDPVTAQQQQHQQFLGDASGALPNFGDIDISVAPLPDGISIDHVRTFEQMYREHAEAVLDVVVNLHFSLIEALWQGFWRNSPSDQHPDNENETWLPKEKLYILCRYEPILKYVRRADYSFYQAIVEVLIPDVLRPIPSSLTQAIRNFAKSLENWLKSAMHGVPEEMVNTKVGAVSAFAQTLRRYTSLNHLAQAARAVLQNTSQITQMLTDLNRVDFANVQEQASWVCQCDDSVVHQLEQDFKKTLQQQNSLEQWAVWLEGVVNQVLKPHEGSPNFPKAARQFLLKWSFYSSMVIRDLTLRSAASFGSFHLIRLLYDEFMFYLVEHKVATATDETPIAVMGEFADLGSAVNTLESECKSISNNITSLTTKPITNSITTTSATGGISIINRVNESTNTTVSPQAPPPTTVMVLASGNTMTLPHSGLVSTPAAMAIKTHPVGTPISGGKTTFVVMPMAANSAGDASGPKRLKAE